jgi:DNA-binding transcriptional regulator YiaG
MQNWLEKKTELLLLLAKEMTPKRIKSIRSSYNLTQESFAMLLDISYNTYRNWEIGHRNPCTSAVSLLTLAEQNLKLFLKQQKQFKNDKN